MRVFQVRLSAIVLMLIPVTLMAGGMSLEQISRLESIGEIALSPDGTRLAYTRIVPRALPEAEDGPAWRELHVIDLQGRNREYVGGEVDIHDIGWLPDGSAISFLNQPDEDEPTALYLIPVDGGEARKIATAGDGVSGYDFSPDGARLALIAVEAESEETEELRDQGFDQIVYEEDWKPRRLWIKQRDAATAPAEPLAIDGSVQQVRWSPAGDRLAVSVTPRQLVDDTLMFQRLRIVSADGETHGRVDTPGKLDTWNWSPDGAHLALIATEQVNDTRAGRLMVVGGDGGEWTSLLPDLEGHVIDLGWRGAERVLFVSHEGVESRLGEVNIDGGSEQTLLSESGLIVHALDASRAGTIALTVSTPDHPREAYALVEDDTAPRRLTRSNDWLDAVDLAPQEVVTYEARDGLEIQGLLVRPLDYREGERYPLILAVHGGPESHYSNGWLTSYNLPAQHAAAEGYFMFYPNYRGSTGRGVEFALLSQGRPAQEEFDDLVDGVDHLIDRGLVDPERVGITGGSYGGYATAWGATRYSDRFAAAVMNVGLSDKIAMLGTSDIPQELYLVHYRTWPWEDWDLYRQASPIFHVRNAATPILILHGDADPRVDPTQSRILYRYLTLQEDPPPVRLVLYPGEGHGNQRAAARWDYSLRLMRWMNHYLKGEGGDPPPHRLDYGFKVDH